MSMSLIAVPSELPGGLDAPLAGHFGRCDVYTLVRIDNGTIADVTLLPGLPHAEGGCMVPVRLLADHGVDALVAGGMGRNPLMGFMAAGIAVYRPGRDGSVGAAVQALLAGEAEQFTPQHACGAHH
ncbi:NifB/NifX family molybdenum-iron cluster-binding protein [Phaeospirillum tilakii]|uniref:NifB/NifX family molybdenum-iron cluster-binding protein n=1 Tax=Phaeospirillum tilakii TaxID=741673 RepID=A0ABW5C8Y5_9PROT